MTELRRFLWAPALAALGYVAAVAAAPAAQADIGFAFRIGCALLTTIGCVAAARAFERGDYPRAPWLLLAGTYGLLLLSHVALRFVAWPGMLPFRIATNLLSNVCLVAAIWRFATAHRVAGLELPGSPTNRRLVQGLAGALALLVIVTPLVTAVRRVAAGDLLAITMAVSSLFDLAALTLMAGLLLTALALRGGLLAWPWSFLTAASVSWLIYDAQGTIGILVETWSPVWGEPFRLLGITLTFAAAMAQRTLVARREAAPSARAAA